MKERIEALMAEIEALECKSEQEIEEARVRLLGKKRTCGREGLRLSYEIYKEG